MENFCGSKFWDLNVTWNTENPDFTSCFQKTALVWIPCGFLWLLAPLDLYYQVCAKNKGLPWTGLSIFKLFLAFCLVGLSMAAMIHDLLLFANDMPVFPADYYAGFVKSMTYLLVAVMIYLGKVRGIRSSGIQFIFWLLTALSEIVIFRSVLLKIFSKDVFYSKLDDRYTFVVVTFTFPIVVGQLFLNIFADKGSTHKQNRVCPEDTSSFLSKITFWWFNGMVIQGHKVPLNLERMWDLSRENSSEENFKNFDKYWKPKTAKRIDSYSNGTAKIISRSNSVRSAPEKDGNKASIFFPSIKCYGMELFVSGLFKLIGSVVTFGNPLLLNLLIDFIGSDQPFWRGLLYAVLIFVVSMVESIFTSQYDYYVTRIAMKIRSCITSALFRKALSLSSTARKDYTVGEIVNLMAVDTQRVMDEVHLVHLLWSAPIQIAIALYMLWQQIGISTLAGLCVMIVMIPINGWIVSNLKRLQADLMKEKDKRTKLMSEVLSGIKVLKLYAWEESFQDQVMKLRKREIVHLTSMAYFSAGITFIFSAAPFLVAIGSFATFVLISPDNILDAKKAFVSLSLFNILRMPLAFLPMLVTFTAMFLVSLKRLDKFLNGDELDPDATERSDREDTPICIENGNFSWSKTDGPTLKNIDLSVKKGSLVAIVGQVGVGKSSLLSALLGDMNKLTGRVSITGSVAYVPQQAWIQNASLRKNILFTKDFEEKSYQRAIDKCCLAPDLEILPGGDNTEIGEKGINLSGGQKQRVSLARAVYSNADIYLLDDPLSAVDSHVSKDLFDNIIGNAGLLKKKTRILVTHRVTVLPHVDTIVVLKEGEITEMGSYAELLMQKGAFAEFLIQYLTNEGAEEVDGIMPDDLHIIEQIAATVGSPELQRQISRLSGGESDDQSRISADSGGKKFLRQVSQTSQPGTLRRRLSSVSSVVKTQKSAEENKRSSRSKLIDAEVAEIGSVKWSIYFAYFRACGMVASAWVMLAYLATYALNMGSSIWLTKWSNDALDNSTYGNTALRDLRLGVYGALGAGETIFTLLATLLISLACLRASRLLHDQALQHILMAPMSFFDTTPMGRILNRFSKDVDTVDMTIRFNLRMFFMSIFRSISAILIIAIQSALILAAILPLGVFYYVVQMYYIATSRQLKRLESVSKSPVYTHFSETITGSTSIRAYGAASLFIEESNNRVDTNHSSYFPLIASNRWLAIRLEFLGYCIAFFSALFAVLAQDTLTPGMAGLAVSYAMTVTGTLNMLVRATCDVETNIVSVERCLEYTKTPTEADRLIEATKPKPDWPNEGRIQFDNYATRYREGLDLVLKGISCTIEPTEKVGIVGRTGAGKSSLTLSIFRLIEAAGGRILIDGVDISKLGLYSLRAKLTIIPQDPVLFAGNLRLNLDPFEEHTDEELWGALEHAHLKTFVSSLEKGLEHGVSEGGENLSVGQRQLLCLARALLRKTKVLVMDEATAAVDMETDELIQTTIRSEFADCTVLTIAHRLNTILDYNKVIVLDKGEITEFDSPENLLQDPKSAFYAMAKDANLV